MLTGVYPIRTSRRSSSSVIVAMLLWLWLIPTASALLDPFEMVGWSAFPSTGSAPVLESLESALISMVDGQRQSIKKVKGRSERDLDDEGKVYGRME